MTEYLEHAQLGESTSAASTSAISDEVEVLGLAHVSEEDIYVHIYGNYQVNKEYMKKIIVS